MKLILLQQKVRLRMSRSPDEGTQTTAQFKAPCVSDATCVRTRAASEVWSKNFSTLEMRKTETLAGPLCWEGTRFKRLPTSEGFKSLGKWRHRQQSNLKDKMTIFMLFHNFCFKKKQQKTLDLGFYACQTCAPFKKKKSTKDVGS